MIIRAWDDARQEFFNYGLPGCCGFSVDDGVITAWAKYENHSYSCEVQVAHPTISPGVRASHLISSRRPSRLSRW